MSASNHDHFGSRAARRLSSLTLRDRVVVGVTAAIATLLLCALVLMYRAVPPSWLRFGQNSLDSNLYAVSCPSVSRCYAAGANGGLYRSTDGGISWSGRHLPSNYPFSALSCATVTHCVVASSGNGPGNVATTSDGGGSWTVRTGVTGIIRTL